MDCFEETLKPFVRSSHSAVFRKKYIVCQDPVQESFAFHAQINPCSSKQAGLQQDLLDIWPNWSQWLMSLF